MPSGIVSERDNIIISLIMLNHLRHLHGNHLRNKSRESRSSSQQNLVSPTTSWSTYFINGIKNMCQADDLGRVSISLLRLVIWDVASRGRLFRWIGYIEGESSGLIK